MTNTPTHSTPPLYDKSAIVEAFGAIVGVEQITELRALDAVTTSERFPHTVSGYFDEPTKLAEAVGTIKTAKGIYIVPNPIEPALLARAANRLRKAPKGDSTQDSNILRRRWLLVDCDPQRPSGISATEDEHNLALERTRDIYRYLKALGWSDPIAADSGNGAHLMYSIDLPTDDGGVVQRCLSALAARFDDENVKIDQTVFNSGQLWKLYGTTACKGDDTVDRAHRMARILNRPNAIQPVPPLLLTSLASEVATQPAQATRVEHGNGRAFDVPTFIDRHNLDVTGPEDWNGQQGRGRLWVFNTSPMCDHNDGAVYLIEHAGGAVSASCHHDSCKWGWRELRARYEPRTGKSTAASVSSDSSSGGGWPNPKRNRSRLLSGE